VGGREDEEIFTTENTENTEGRRGKIKTKAILAFKGVARDELEKSFGI
jgi:hypothetical protein